VPLPIKQVFISGPAAGGRGAGAGWAMTGWPSLTVKRIASEITAAAKKVRDELLKMGDLRRPWELVRFHSKAGIEVLLGIKPPTAAEEVHLKKIRDRFAPSFTLHFLEVLVPDWLEELNEIDPRLANYVAYHFSAVSWYIFPRFFAADEDRWRDHAGALMLLWENRVNRLVTDLEETDPVQETGIVLDVIPTITPPVAVTATAAHFHAWVGNWWSEWYLRMRFAFLPMMDVPVRTAPPPPETRPGGRVRSSVPRGGAETRRAAESDYWRDPLMRVSWENLSRCLAASPGKMPPEEQARLKQLFESQAYAIRNEADFANWIRGVGLALANGYDMAEARGQLWLTHWRIREGQLPFNEATAAAIVRQEWGHLDPLTGSRAEYAAVPPPPHIPPEQVAEVEANIQRQSRVANGMVRGSRMETAPYNQDPAAVRNELRKPENQAEVRGRQQVEAALIDTANGMRREVERPTPMEWVGTTARLQKLATDFDVFRDQVREKVDRLTSTAQTTLTNTDLDPLRSAVVLMERMSEEKGLTAADQRAMLADARWARGILETLEGRVGQTVDPAMVTLLFQARSGIETAGDRIPVGVPNAQTLPERPVAAPGVFMPGTEWTEVPAGAVLPPGCEIRMDVATGRNYARIPPGAVTPPRSPGSPSAVQAPAPTATGATGATPPARVTGAPVPQDTRPGEVGANLRAAIPPERVEPSFEVALRRGVVGTRQVRDMTRQEVEKPGGPTEPVTAAEVQQFVNMHEAIKAAAQNPHLPAETREALTDWAALTRHHVATIEARAGSRPDTICLSSMNAVLIRGQMAYDAVRTALEPPRTEGVPLDLAASGVEGNPPGSGAPVAASGGAGRSGAPPGGVPPRGGGSGGTGGGGRPPRTPPPGASGGGTPQPNRGVPNVDPETGRASRKPSRSHQVGLWRLLTARLRNSSPLVTGAAAAGVGIIGSFTFKMFVWWNIVTDPVWIMSNLGEMFGWGPGSVKRADRDFTNISSSLIGLDDHLRDWGGAGQVGLVQEAITGLQVTLDDWQEKSGAPRGEPGRLLGATPWRDPNTGELVEDIPTFIADIIDTGREGAWVNVRTKILGLLSLAEDQLERANENAPVLEAEERAVADSRP